MALTTKDGMIKKKKQQILFTIHDCIAEALDASQISCSVEQILFLLKHKNIIDERNMIKSNDDLKGLFINRLSLDKTGSYKEQKIKEVELFVTVKGKAWLLKFIQENRVLFNL